MRRQSRITDVLPVRKNATHTVPLVKEIEGLASTPTRTKRPRLPSLESSRRAIRGRGRGRALLRGSASPLSSVQRDDGGNLPPSSLPVECGNLSPCDAVLERPGRDEEAEAPSSPPSSPPSVSSPRSSAQTIPPSPAAQQVFVPPVLPTPPPPSSSQPPAYERFAHLARPGLSIPLSYQRLEKTFAALETTCSLYRGRKICTYERVKEDVERTTNRTFTLKHLAQICTIAPHAYNFEQIRIEDLLGKKNYELQIEVNEPLENFVMSSPRVPVGTSDLSSLEMGSPRYIREAVMRSRRDAFHQTLVARVAREHEKFLVARDIRVDSSKIRQWDSLFRKQIEQLPEIEEAILPSPPTPKPHGSVIQQLLNSKSSKDLTPANRRALERAAERLTSPSTKAGPEPTPVTAEGEAPKELQGLNPDLLKRVRQKEARSLQAQDQSARTADHEKKRAILQKLPRVADSVHSLFGKRYSMDLSEVVDRLSTGQSCDSSALRVQLMTLAEIAPDCFRVVDVQGKKYLQRDPGAFTEARKALAEASRRD